MHGVILTHLKKFAEARLGPGGWHAVNREAGLKPRIYSSLQSYPDAEGHALVNALARLAGRPAPELLREFGAFIAPDLLSMYRSFIRPGWGALDVIAHTESRVHGRSVAPGGPPPTAVAKRTGEHEIVIEHPSSVGLCAASEGFAQVVAFEFKQRVTVDHPRCVHRGDADCKIVVRQIG